MKYIFACTLGLLCFISVHGAGVEQAGIQKILDNFLRTHPYHATSAEHKPTMNYVISGNGMPYGVQITLQQSSSTLLDVGTVRLDIDNDDAPITLCSLKTDKNWRKKGIGSLLFSLAKSIADKLTRSMVWEAIPFNITPDGQDHTKNLILFYTQRGGVVVKEKDYVTHMRYTPHTPEKTVTVEEESKTPLT